MLNDYDPDSKIIWEPLKGSQSLALDTRCHHTLFDGTRGPGKTITQLMHYRQYVGLGYGEYWRGVLFDLEFDNLSGLVAESKKWFLKFMDGAKWHASASAYKWVWPTGEELLFRHVKKLDDYEGFHGHEYPWIGWNELTKHPTGELYEKFHSVNRSSFDPVRDTPINEDGTYATPDGQPLPHIPLRVFSTTNPNGPGHNWVKKKFVTASPPGKVLRRTAVVFNPRSGKEEEVTKTQVRIFGHYKENKYLPPEYIAELDAISDPNLRKAWLDGNWDVTAGGAFDDLWKSDKHIVDRFVIPHYWHVTRAFDWGSTHPFSVGWYAISNGEEAILPDGSSFCPPAGSIIRFFEFYGSKPEDYGMNKGVKLGATKVAEGIRDREIAMMENGWLRVQPMAGPADNQIRNVTEADTPTIADSMSKVGIDWMKSDKSPGSRKIGLELARGMLESATDGSGRPAFYVTRNCKAFIELFPGLVRDPKNPDDVLTTQEDHVWDEMRYMVLGSDYRSAYDAVFTKPL